METKLKLNQEGKKLVKELKKLLYMMDDFGCSFKHLHENENPKYCLANILREIKDDEHSKESLMDMYSLDEETFQEEYQPYLK